MLFLYTQIIHSPMSFLISFLIIRQSLKSTLFPYTTLFRSDDVHSRGIVKSLNDSSRQFQKGNHAPLEFGHGQRQRLVQGDRKSTRLNSSHQIISYAVFCLKKKKNNI